jgi:hypothetical protein
MRRHLAPSWVRWAAVGAGVLAANACNTGPSPLASDVAVAPPVVPPGGAFAVTMIVRNVGDETLTFVGSSSCRLGFEIVSAGTVVNYAPQVCTDDLVWYDLEPQEAISGTLEWTAVDVDGDVLPAGVYEVRVVAEVAEPEAHVAEGIVAKLTVAAPELQQ